MSGKKKELEKEYKEGWGGKREGSGRKQIGPPKKKVTFYVTEAEKEQLQKYLATLRAEKLGE